jgi:hypothetical protein
MRKKVAWNPQMKILAFTLICVSGAGAHAVGTNLSHWTRSNGHPAGDCFLTDSPNVAAEESLTASSSDSRMGWAISTNEIGVTVASCLRSGLATDVNENSWAVIRARDKAAIIIPSLWSGTAALLDRHPDLAPESRRMYLTEADALASNLKPYLAKLFQDAERRHAGFLRKQSPINIPTP